MYWYGPHMGGWGWGLGLIAFIVFWALAATVIISLIRLFLRGDRRRSGPYRGNPGGPGPWDQPGPAPGRGPSTPEQILAERYARGEIGEEEFRHRMAVLRAEAPHQPTGSTPV